MKRKRTSILERLKVCWYVLTKSYYLYFGLDKDLIVWNEDDTYKCLKESSLKCYEYISEECEFMAHGRKTNLRSFALRVIAKFINTELIEEKTDKEKLHQILSSLWKNDDSVGKTYYNQALQDVQTAIDFQEEPQVKESLISKHEDKTCKENGDSLTQEEDLKEAAKHYLYSNILYDDVYVGNPTDKDCIEMFNAGAKWQKERMSKQVLDATVHPSDGEIWVDCIFDLAPFKEDEKVKVIIIKED